jgi:STE24 endopeptidase
MNTTGFELNPSLAMTLVFAATLVASQLLKFWLATRQIRHVASHRQAVPPVFSQRIDIAAHQKAADYTIAKMRFALLELSFGMAMTLFWTLFGGLHFLNQVLLGWMGTGLAQQVTLLVSFVLIGSVIELPFTLYQTFRIEQRFGFNKTTLKLWLQDSAKSSLLGLVVGFPLIALVLWVMGATGALWWLYSWCVWMGFNLLLLLVYPTWIAPIFNKFEPLENPEIARRAAALMQRCGFTSKGFYVMDGSRRSAHANAYFTGLGASKRVVFYDTLLSQLSASEVEAVLAHELGHFKHKHISKRIVSMFALSLIGFALLGFLSTQSWFYTGLGVIPNIAAANDALALLLFMLVLPFFGTFIGPIFAYVSRSHEYEADAYAVSQTNPVDLGQALMKLYKDNASTLTPDPLYVQFYYSHPPALERLGRMHTTVSVA